MNKTTGTTTPARQATPELSPEALRQAKDRGAEMLMAGNLEAALAAFQQVARALPGEPLWRQKVAEVLQRLGRKGEAIAEYQATAEEWARTGWMLRAIALCKVILQLDAGHTRTQSLLADLYARRAQARPAVGSEPTVAPVAAAPMEALKLPPFPLFSALAHDVFLELLAGLERRVFQPGDLIVREGEPGHSMFVIVEGGADVVRQGEEGQGTTVAHMGEGEFFGEIALVAEARRLATVVASGRTVLLEVTREKMAEIIARHPSVGEVVQEFYRERLLRNVMRSNPLFSGVPEEPRRALAESFTPLTVKQGEQVLSRGQAAPGLFLLLRGRCEVFHAHVDGRETPYPDMREGDVFGEVSLLRSGLVTASVRAATPCMLLKLGRETFDALLEKHPELRAELKRLSEDRLKRTAQLLSGRPVHPGDARV